jgi:anti-sigma factor RsiW
MSTEGPCPGVEELNAYVDGELDDARRAALEAHLARCPEDAQRVAAYRRGDEALRAAFDELYTGGLPLERLSWRIRRHRTARRLRLAGVAASAAIIALGAWWLRDSRMSSEASRLAHSAAAAYRLYATESAQGAASQAPAGGDELSRWLSDRIGKPMRVPDLQGLGYRLVDVRLLPGSITPAAQLMYRDRAGHHVACYFVAVSASGEAELRYAQDGPVGTFYGVEDNLGYAVTGDADAEELRAVADAAYRASEGRPPEDGAVD